MNNLGDAADRLIVDEMSSYLQQLRYQQLKVTRVAVLDDVTGELTALAVLALDALGLSTETIRVSCDSLTAQRAVAAKVLTLGLSERVHICDEVVDAVRDAGLILLRLPKSLAALEEMAETIAQHAAPQVQLLAGNRVIHMSRAMNTVLSQHFGSVNASLGRQRSRVLRASRLIRAEAPTFPRSLHHDDLDLEVWAHGAAFGGTQVDLGTRLLLTCFDRLPVRVGRAIDLGCGTGVLATELARRRPEATVVAIDDSRAACLSTARTVTANAIDQRVAIHRAIGLSDEIDESADLIVCNPPFHIGTRKDSTPAFEMFAGASRVLTSGGELWVVFNSHLPYRQSLRRLVGPTELLAQDAKYVVVRACKG